MPSKGLIKPRLAFVLCILVVFNAITLVVVYGPWNDAHFSLGSQVFLVILFLMTAIPGALIGSIGSRFFRRFMVGVCIGALVAHPAHKFGLIALGLLGLPSNWWAQCCFLLASIVSFGTGLLLGRRSARSENSCEEAVEAVDG